MKIYKSAVATLLATLILSSTVSAHDPSKHKAVAEKPNCDAIKKMDHSERTTDDPVMRAMMAKCRSQLTEEATLEEYPLKESNRKYRPKTGHNAPMEPSAPPHEEAYHQKVYEVPDCENMSNMYHSSTEQYDPILQDMMKRCAATEAAKATKENEASNGGAQHDDHN